MQDETGAYPFNTGFADTLDKLGLPYEFQSYNGGHLDQFTKRLPIVFHFLDSVMNTTVGISEEVTIQPKIFYLYQNYPNPFNPSTKIKFVIPKSSFINLTVYDILSNKVTTLVNEEKPAGTYEVTWNTTSSGGGLPSGVYFYQLKAGNYTATKKLLLLK